MTVKSIRLRGHDMRKIPFKFEYLRSISPGVWGVSIAMMLIAISTSMTFSISPFFVTKVLGLSMISMGMIEGLSEGLSQISKLLSGYTGDLFKRKKPPLMLGAILATISKPLFILAAGPAAVIASKAVERISNGIMATPRDAYVAEAACPRTKGKSLGLMMSLKTIGCTIGSVTIGALMFLTEDYRTLLWIGFVPCILSVFVLMKYMPEQVDAAPTVAKKEKQKLCLADFKELKFDYWSLIFVSTLFMCARFSDGFLILRLSEMGAPTWLSASTIGIFNLISAFCCFPIGNLSDKFDRSRILYFSFITLVLSNLCFVSSSLSIGLLGVVCWGAQRGTSQVLFSAIIADLAPKKIIGTALGIFYLITGVISVVAGAAAGHLADKALEYAFWFGLAVSLSSLLFLFIRNEFLMKRTGTPPKEATLAGV